MEINVNSYTKELDRYILQKNYKKDDLKTYNQTRDTDLLQHMQMYILNCYFDNNVKKLSDVKKLNSKLFNAYISEYR